MTMDAYWLMLMAEHLAEEEENVQFEKDWAGDTPLFSRQQKDKLKFGKKHIKKLRPPFWFQICLMCIAVLCVMTSAVSLYLLWHVSGNCSMFLLFHPS